MSDTLKTIVIVGPTASGKSDVANLLASKINGEVISADSMQIYKGMDIGTGKISPSEQKVTHWGLDIVSPDQAYSAAVYQDYARKCICDIQSEGKTPVVCGGTGFYVRAAIDDYKFPKGEQVDNELREKYQEYADKNGAHAIWSLLKDKDPKSAEVIHENNVVRVIRALELLEDGKNYYKQLENLSNIEQKIDAVFFGLEVDPGILRKRIEERVDSMFDAGLVDEVKSLLDNGYRDALTAASAIGYKEVVEYLDNKIDLEQAKEQIKSATKKYAKRQRTWFNKDKRIH